MIIFIRDAMIVNGASPEKFQRYFGEFYKRCCEYEKKFLLLTAWNEWGEGAYLEPDTESGYAYLEAIKHVVESVN